MRKNSSKITIIEKTGGTQEFPYSKHKDFSIIPSCVLPLTKNSLNGKLTMLYQQENRS